jgi:hypothetical protein
MLTKTIRYGAIIVVVGDIKDQIIEDFKNSFG